MNKQGFPPGGHSVEDSHPVWGTPSFNLSVNSEEHDQMKGVREWEKHDFMSKSLGNYQTNNILLPWNTSMGENFFFYPFSGVHLKGEYFFEQL